MEQVEKSPQSGGRFRAFLRAVLPLAIVVGAIVVVVILVTLARGKRPERVETGEQAVLVETIVAELKIYANQCSVKPCLRMAVLSPEQVY